MGFARSAEQVAGLIKKKISLKDVFDDIQNNTSIVHNDNAPVVGKRPIPSGNRSPFMFVGQNPSFWGSTDGRFEQDQQQKFFEDKKLGPWIDKICDFFTLRRSDVYVTNAIKYPTKDNEEPFFKDGKIHIKQFFFKEIYLIKPEIIFVMGKWTQQLFKKMFFCELIENKLEKVKIQLDIDGNEIEYETFVYPIHHPSYVERNHDFSLYEKQLTPIKEIIEQIKIDWKFIHLHCHNSMSLKDGVGTPETRIQWSIENGKPAVATSNHGNICDWLNIYNKCKSNNIKPILGIEFYFNRYAKELRAAINSEGPDAILKRKEYRKMGSSHFTAFAKNLKGFYNIIKIHNDAWVNGFYYNPFTSPEMIKENSEGMIVLSGCSGAEQNRILGQKYYILSEKRKQDIDVLVGNKIKSIKSLFRTKDEEKSSNDEYLDDYDIRYFKERSEDKLDEQHYKQYIEKIIEESDKEIIESAERKARAIVDWWHSIFKDDYYIELMVIDFEMQKFVNQELIKIAKEKNIPIVITNDAHYLTVSGAEIQKLQMLNDQGATFEDLKNDSEEKLWTIKSKDLYYKSVTELKEAWEAWHKTDVFTEEVFWEGIKNAISVADKIETFTIDKSNKLPKLYDDSAKALAAKITAGLKNKGLNKKKEYLERAKFEFEVIVKKGFADYFLILEDIINWTKNKFGRFSVGAGRGSAAGSLVNYVIGITDVDPLKHDLLFERFMDIERADSVDIDSDFEPRIRDSVIDYIIERFGKEHVSAIGTFGITRTKVAIQDVARVFGIPPQDTLIVTKNLDEIDEDASLEEIENQNPALKEYLDVWEKNLSTDLRYYINGIRGSHRQISQHAAGILVSSDKLMENIALIQARKRIVTGWQEGSDYHELSDLGYFKYDVLGLCLEEDTLIETDQGSIQIKNIDGTRLKSLDKNKKEIFIEEDNYILIDSGYKDCIEITLEDGSKIICSPEHKLFKEIE